MTRPPEAEGPTDDEWMAEGEDLEFDYGAPAGAPGEAPAANAPRPAQATQPQGRPGPAAWPGGPAPAAGASAFGAAGPSGWNPSGPQAPSGVPAPQGGASATGPYGAPGPYRGPAGEHPPTWHAGPAAPPSYGPASPHAQGPGAAAPTPARSGRGLDPGAIAGIIGGLAVLIIAALVITNLLGRSGGSPQASGVSSAGPVSSSGSGSSDPYFETKAEMTAMARTFIEAAADRDWVHIDGLLVAGSLDRKPGGGAASVAGLIAGPQSLATAVGLSVDVKDIKIVEEPAAEPWRVEFDLIYTFTADGATRTVTVPSGMSFERAGTRLLVSQLYARTDQALSQWTSDWAPTPLSGEGDPSGGFAPFGCSPTWFTPAETLNTYGAARSNAPDCLPQQGTAAPGAFDPAVAAELAKPAASRVFTSDSAQHEGLGLAASTLDPVGMTVWRFELAGQPYDVLLAGTAEGTARVIAAVPAS